MNTGSNNIDNGQIPTCNIMGVKIAAINMDDLIAFTQKRLYELSGRYICVSNVHTTVTAFENEQYCQVQNSAVLAIPDGGPLSVIGRRRGFSSMSRTTGPDYMGEIFKISASKGFRHYFYGATPDTLNRLCQNLAESYPGIEIVGAYSPPFRPLTKDERATVVAQINHAAPDFVWVGLGAPKQEYWMAEHSGIISGLMVGVGAGFDYWAGNIKRAPQWMQKHSLEWFYRLLQDPKRLLTRYLYTNTKFIWYAVICGK